MKTNKLTRGKTILAIAMALVLAAGFYLVGNNAFAAGGGTVTVKVSNGGTETGQPWPSGTRITYNIYKVGEYDHDADGNAVFKLDSKLSGAAGVSAYVSSSASYDNTASDWAQNWVDQANTLSKHINGLEDSAKPDKLDPVTVEFKGEGDSLKTASFTCNLPTDGLYLLVGDEFEVGDYLWSPQAVFLSALNGSEKNFDFSNTSAVQKMTSRKVVYEHNVTKIWVGDEAVQDYVRPEKIAVKIMYGTTPIDTVVLEKSKDYSFSWKHKKLNQNDTKITYYPEGNTEGIPKTVKSTDAGWSVVELREDNAAGTAAAAEAVKLRYYTTSYAPGKTISDDGESFTISNTFTCKYLKLRKTIDGYDGDGQNMTFSFKIVGKDSDGKVIYTNHAGVTFTQKDGLTKETVINYIPGAVESIEVEEEYSGNYELVGDKVTVTELKEMPKTETAQSGETGSDEEAAQTDNAAEPKVVGWEATADNKHGDHGPKGGVVNRYDTNKDSPRQDPGTAPASQTETPDEGAN